MYLFIIFVNDLLLIAVLNALPVYLDNIAIISRHHILIWKQPLVRIINTIFSLYLIL